MAFASLRNFCPSMNLAAQGSRKSQERRMSHPFSIHAMSTKRLRIFQHLLVAFQSVHLIQLGLVIDSGPAGEVPYGSSYPPAGDDQWISLACIYLQAWISHIACPSRALLIEGLWGKSRTTSRHSTRRTRVRRQPMPSSARAMRSLPQVLLILADSHRQKSFGSL